MLRPLRQVHALNATYTTPWTQERGGILCYGAASGITIVEYKANPSGAIPVGVQYNDVEWMDLSFHPDPRRNREVEFPCGIVGVLTDGDFETDWIHIIGSVFTGDPAYVGPSGLFTNSSSFGGTKVGKFIKPFVSDPHLVTYRGLGFSRSYMRNGVVIVENDPNNRTLVQSDGYATLHIDQFQIIHGN